MRVGFNPQKDVPNQATGYLHQIIIPVYIPSLDGYFKDAMQILSLCLNSLFKSTHNRTFISVINNGSCNEVLEYLNSLLKNGQIHEVVHTENIGKLNAILKGLAGSNIPLVTICDADVLFVDGWQQETIHIFNHIPEAGVLGLVPQMYTFRYASGNAIYDNLFNSRLKFLPVPDREAMLRFYDSVGWKGYNLDHTKYVLALDYSENLQAMVGSGHFVATYRRDIFDEIKTYIGFKLGGDSEAYLDTQPLKKGYWRLTTRRNFAFHMGNVAEEWMHKLLTEKNALPNIPAALMNFETRKPISDFKYYFINKLFVRFIKFRPAFELFLRMKKLPSEMVKNY